MDVRELKQDYIDQLKFGLYYMQQEEIETQFCDALNDEIIIELENANFPYDISNETIYILFSGFNFVDDDFVSCEPSIYDLKLNLTDKYFKEDIQKFIFNAFFEYCTGKRNNKIFYVYNGNKAYYDDETDKIYLEEDDYFKYVIREDEDFIKYLQKHYGILEE